MDTAVTNSQMVLSTDSSVKTDTEEKDDLRDTNRELERIQTELQNFVFENYNQLLDQMVKIESLERDLEQLDSRISQMTGSLDSIKNIVGEPYKMIANRMVLLQRLQTTCDLLRKILRILTISSRLQVIQELIDTSEDEKKRDQAFKDLVKYGAQIKEMESIIDSDHDRLISIHCIQKEIKSFLRFKESFKIIINQAKSNSENDN